jgi:hypothetical protein
MAKHYVTLGQGHVHSVAGKTLDKDTVAVFEAESREQGRALAFEIFGDKFCFDYHAEEWNPDNLMYFPKGYVEI